MIKLEYIIGLEQGYKYGIEESLTEALKISNDTNYIKAIKDIALKHGVEIKDNNLCEYDLVVK